MTAKPIIVVITRRIRPEAIPQFEQAVRDWVPKATQFPGHQGVLLLHPPESGDEYGAVLRFRSAEDWQRFRQWPDYVAWMEGLQPLLAAPPRVEELHGLEAWFRSAEHYQPPRWKMALVTWVGVSATVYALSETLAPALESWHFLVRFLFLNAAVVVILTWAVMPLLTSALYRWLTASHPSKR